MTTQAMFDGPALFKQDSVRRIDGLIDYFGEAAAAESSHERSTAPASNPHPATPAPPARATRSSRD